MNDARAIAELKRRLSRAATEQELKQSRRHDAKMGPHREVGDLKWPKETKPTAGCLMAMLLALVASAQFLGEPVFIFSDDASNYFNQFALAPSELWKFVTILKDATTKAATFLAEYCMGFGTRPSSNIAQRAEFCRGVLRLGDETMHGLYVPLRAENEASRGPNRGCAATSSSASEWRQPAQRQRSYRMWQRSQQSAGAGESPPVSPQKAADNLQEADQSPTAASLLNAVARNAKRRHDDDRNQTRQQHIEAFVRDLEILAMYDPIVHDDDGA